MNNTFCKNCHRIPSQCVCRPQTKLLSDITNGRLIEEVRNRGYKIKNAEIQTKPLSDEEIEPITEMMADMYNQMSLQWKNSRGYSEQCDIMKAIFRAIEAKVREEK